MVGFLRGSSQGYADSRARPVAEAGAAGPMAGFQALAQERCEALIAAFSEADGAQAHQLKTCLAVGFTQAQDAQAGPLVLSQMDA